jgi:hypothetical protein
MFAARDTTSLVATEAEAGRYYERWRHLAEAEPALALAGVTRPRGIGGFLGLTTTNPAVIAAWPRNLIVTGDAAFDAITSEIGVIKVGGTGNSLYFSADLVYSEEVVEQHLAPTMSHLDAPERYYTSDGTWTWLGEPPGSVGNDAATASIKYDYGWGDCLVGCIEWHHFQIVIPPGGPADVTDLGGDPMVLSPSTHPPR